MFEFIIESPPATVRGLLRLSKNKTGIPVLQIQLLPNGSFDTIAAFPPCGMVLRRGMAGLVMPTDRTGVLAHTENDYGDPYFE